LENLIVKAEAQCIVTDNLRLKVIRDFTIKVVRRERSILSSSSFQHIFYFSDWA